MRKKEGGMDFSQGAKPIIDPGSDTPRDPAVVGENQIKIISFNIRTGGADTGTSNAWTERRSGTPQMLSVENPTIFGLQEAQLYQADFVKSSLEGYDYVGVSRDTGTAAGAGERMPIFWKTSLVQLEDWGTFWLSSTPEIPSVGWAEGSTYRRCATWARFRHIATGKRFFYINTHLDLVRDNRPRPGPGQPDLRNGSDCEEVERTESFGLSVLLDGRHERKLAFCGL